MLSCACVGNPFGTNESDNKPQDPPEEYFDLRESLRVYGRKYLQAPEDPWAPVVRIRKVNDFGDFFLETLKTQGWPVLKCNNHKGLRRSLGIENGKFVWGSKKNASVAFADITQVTKEKFTDGPPGADPKCMLVFSVEDTHGLKFLTETEADAIVVAHGFNILIDRKNNNNIRGGGGPEAH